MKLAVGTKIKFKSEKNFYEIRASNEKYSICTKPYNPRKTVLYTIVNFTEKIRGSENLVFGFGAETDIQCEEMLNRLTKGETEISRRNRKKLDIEKIIKIDDCISLYESGWTTKEVGEKFGISKELLQFYFNKIGYECRKYTDRHPTRKSPRLSWNANNISYTAQHRRVYRARGSPSKCELCKTTENKNKYDWANLTGNYNDVNDFMRMCKKCHKNFDIAKRKNV